MNCSQLGSVEHRLFQDTDTHKVAVFSEQKPVHSLTQAPHKPLCACMQLLRKGEAEYTVTVFLSYPLVHLLQRPSQGGLVFSSTERLASPPVLLDNRWTILGCVHSLLLLFSRTSFTVKISFCVAQPTLTLWLEVEVTGGHGPGNSFLTFVHCTINYYKTLNWPQQQKVTKLSPKEKNHFTFFKLSWNLKKNQFHHFTIFLAKTVKNVYF